MATLNFVALLYYIKLFRHINKKVFWSHSNKLIVMPEVEDWRTSGLCSSSCLRMSSVDLVNISSVSLHAGDRADMVRMMVIIMC